MISQKIGLYLLLLIPVLALTDNVAAQEKAKDTIISVLALGNAYYPSESPFDSYEGIKVGTETTIM